MLPARGQAAPEAREQIEPEGPSTVAAPRAREPVRATRHMVAAAHPAAAEVGREILRKGGSALDAAIAAQLVLNLVEPQSSGIGGGGFLIHFDREAGVVESYDGREQAPASAKPEMFLNAEGRPRSFGDVVAGGLSVGVPGLLRMVELAHAEHGKLPWRDLFEPAIRVAEQGFAVSPRLHEAIARDPHLKNFPDAARYFYDAKGQARAVGSRLTNPTFAQTLRTLADKGASAFYSGDIARDIAAAVSKAPRNAVVMTTKDIESYKAEKRDPVCSIYRVWFVCGAAPPSSGGIATLQILGLLENAGLEKMKPASLDAVHLIAEAGRLAYADRNQYVGDPAFVDVPTASLIDTGYLAERAKLISEVRSMGRAEPGVVAGSQTRFAPAEDERSLSTSHLSIVDDDGNAVAFTTSIESTFGSRLMVRGFLLNNQLTDFSFVPEVAGKPALDRVEPGKRPRSSMAPTLVFDGMGRLVLVTGSPGGARIIGYVANSVISTLDWDLDPQAAAGLAHFANRNGTTELEARTPVAGLKAALEAKGHTVTLDSMTSGLNIIRSRSEVLFGGTDPRREGAALGD
ncbi:MAG: gamma-glutamyltransferase 1 [Rhodospirillales bacterium]|nr:gamma-glutamyltransferase 1 [Rhodospirillales bacterium]